MNDLQYVARILSHTREVKVYEYRYTDPCRCGGWLGHRPIPTSAGLVCDRTCANFNGGELWPWWGASNVEQLAKLKEYLGQEMAKGNWVDK